MEKEEKYTDKSFGQISISRIQCSGKHHFYGSDLPQSHYIQLEIAQSEIIRDLSYDRYHADHTPIIRVRMTANQFSEMVTSLNIGSGTCCTIEQVKNERIQNRELAPVITNYRESVMKGYMQKVCLENSFVMKDRTKFNELLITKAPEEGTIFIAWSNAQVKFYNDLIRTSLFGEMVPKYIVGDRLLFNSSYRRFHTSQQVKISSCEIVNYNLLYPKCICKTEEELFLEMVEREEKEKKRIQRWKNGEEEPEKVDLSEYITKKEVKDHRIEKCKKCYTPTSMSSHKKVDFWEIKLEGIKGVSFFYQIYKFNQFAVSMSLFFVKILIIRVVINFHSVFSVFPLLLTVPFP